MNIPAWAIIYYVGFSFAGGLYVGVKLMKYVEKNPDKFRWLKELRRRET